MDTENWTLYSLFVTELNIKQYWNIFEIKYLHWRRLCTLQCGLYCTIVLLELDILIYYCSMLVLNWYVLDNKLFYRVCFVVPNYSKTFSLFCFIVSKPVTERICFNISCHQFPMKQSGSSLSKLDGEMFPLRCRI